VSSTIDYYYSHYSPWAYMGHQRLIDLAATYGAALRFKPVDGGAVFAVSGGLPLPKRPIQRQNYRMVELKRWRDATGLPLTLKPKFHPGPDRPAALAALAAASLGADIGSFSLALMRGCWVDEKDLSDPDTLAGIATAEGLDGAAVLAAAESEAIVAQLETNTEDAKAAEVFGYPWYIVDGEPFWGQDRLDFVETRLAG